MKKVRIYDLSKELERDNKDILEICSRLDINVKSHSSSVTESQAEEIKEAVKRDNMASSSNQSKTSNIKASKHQSASNLKTKTKKPEILGVYRSKTPESNQSDNSDSTPVLLTPPRPNTAKVASEADQKSHKKLAQEQSSSPNINLQQPPANRNLPKKTTSSSESTPTAELNKPPRPKLQDKTTSPTGEDKSNTSDSGLETQKPKLKIQKNKNNQHRQKNNQRRSDNKENIAISADKEKNLKATSPSSGKNSTQQRDGTAQAQKLSPKLKLQSPPQRPGGKNKLPEDIDLDDELENQTDLPDEVDEVDDGDVLLLDKPKIRKPKQKKSNDLESKRSWDEDDKAIQKKDSKKIGKKRRSLLMDEDEEDFDDYLDENGGDNSEVNLALVRPSQPPSQKQKTVDKSRPAKKPKSKPNKSQSKLEAKSKQEKEQPPELIVLTKNPTVRELSELLQITDTELIKNLFFKGIAVNITETLDIDIATMMAKDMGIEVITEEEKASAIKTEMLTDTDLENLESRPPVVTIMGHVDHGKTTLLDSIRNTKVVQGEAGGITQHIGAYHVDVEHEGKTQQVVFLDTPGHEAFTAMRARGAKVTDIAILVVAADDGVRPQTREAISHARAAKVPIVVAINKIDKPEANPDRVMQELSELELVPEDWGGDTVMVPVSALTGDNIDTLLEMIVIVSEVEELSANPNRPAKGTVIEAHLDRARGPVATLLVQNGTLRVGDVIVAGSVLGRIRAMIDDRGDKVEAASPSFAVEILGLNDTPQAGDEFEVYLNEKEAKAIAESRSEAQRDTRLQQAMSSRRVSLSSLSAQAEQGELKELNLILKGDVQGSVEAILGSLKQLPQNEVQIRVLLSGAGEVTETDVDLAAASGAVIVGFNTTLAPGARQAAEREGVDIREYNVIYKLLDEIQGAMEGLLDPEEIEEHLGQAEVRAVFSVGKNTVAGCYVQSGKVVRNRFIRVLRKGKEIYNGNLDSLRRVKDDVKEVASGFECGIGINKFNNWEEGDIIEAYEMVFKRRTLST
jgi:translation initiation factor IF-2